MQTICQCPLVLANVQGYFDTLRMELSDKGISILSVCPGPVDTPIFKNIFTEKLTSVGLDETTVGKSDRVTAERCAELIVVGMANNLKEIWISKHPILLFVYMFQYFPNLSKW